MSLVLDLTESTSIRDAASVSRPFEGRRKHVCEPEVVFPYEEESGRLLHTHTRQRTMAFGSRTSIHAVWAPTFGGANTDYATGV